MAREKALRLSEQELDKLNAAGECLLGDVADEVPRGRVVDEVAQYVLDSENGGRGD